MLRPCAFPGAASGLSRLFCCGGRAERAIVWGIRQYDAKDRQGWKTRMKPPICDSVFDVAFWLIDRALDDGEYLQPQKLQRLLFLAQAYYAVMAKGDKLMPCVFIASGMGPLEPSSWRAFEHGRPKVDYQKIPQDVQPFLDSLWRKFSPHSADYLNKLVCSHPPYQEAFAQGRRSEITLEAMVAYYGRKPTQNQPGLKDAPPIDRVLRPRVMRSQTGKPVSVTSWTPKRKTPPAS